MSLSPGYEELVFNPFTGTLDFIGSGSGTISNPVTYVFVSPSNATTTLQTLQTVTGLSIPLTTGHTYEFEAVLEVDTSIDTAGTEYGVNYDAGTGMLTAGAMGSLTTSSTVTYQMIQFNTATGPFLTGSSQTGQVVIRGIITT